LVTFLVFCEEKTFAAASKIIVFRFPGSIQPELIQKECQALVGVTRYKKEAKREEAPYLTDCLTSVSHVFKKAALVDLQLDWIGNMPRTLYKKGWQIQKISLNELKTGDLIFLGKKGKLVSHLAVALSEQEVFHVAQKGAGIEKIEDVFAKYIPLQDAQNALSYVDSRSARRTLEYKNQVGANWKSLICS